MSDLDGLWLTRERAAAPPREERRLPWPDRVIEAGALFLLVFTPLAFGTVEPWSEAVAELVVLGMVVVWIVKMVQDWELRIELPPGWVPASLFLALVFFQTVPTPLAWLDGLSPFAAERYRLVAAARGAFSVSPHDTWRLALKLGAVAAFFLVCYNTYRTRRQVHRALWTMVATGALLSVFAIVQRMTWNGHFYWFGPLAPHRSAFGPFTNRAHFAGLMVILVPMAIGHLLAAPPRPARKQLVLTWRDRVRIWNASEGGANALMPWLVMLMGGAALVSGSRGGMVALMASLIVMVALGFHADSRRWTLTGLAMGLLLIVLSGLWIGGEAVSETTERLADEIEVYESSPRVSLWTDALGLWNSARLVGTGLDTFASAFGVVRTIQSPRIYTHAESDFIQLLTDTGSIGIGLVSSGALALSLALVRTRRYARSSTIRAATLGALVGLLGTILQGVANFNLAVTSNLLYATASLTIVLAGDGTHFDAGIERAGLRTTG